MRPFTNKRYPNTLIKMNRLNSLGKITKNMPINNKTRHMMTKMNKSKNMSRSNKTRHMMTRSNKSKSNKQIQPIFKPPEIKPKSKSKQGIWSYFGFKPLKNK